MLRQCNVTPAHELILMRNNHVYRPSFLTSQGLVLCHGGKQRRRASAVWDVPPRFDWLGVLTAGTGSLAPSSAAVDAAGLSKTLAGLKPPQDAAGIVYADYVLKVRPSYQIMRRAVIV